MSFLWDRTDQDTTLQSAEWPGSRSLLLEETYSNTGSSPLCWNVTVLWSPVQDRAMGCPGPQRPPLAAIWRSLPPSSPALPDLTSWAPAVTSVQDWYCWPPALKSEFPCFLTRLKHKGSAILSQARSEGHLSGDPGGEAGGGRRAEAPLWGPCGCCPCMCPQFPTGTADRDVRGISRGSAL